MTLTVFTAAIGRTEPVQRPESIDPAVRYLCFSDRKCPKPYVWIEVPHLENGRTASRRIKVLADHPALQETDATLWHDASYRLSGSLDWVRDALRTGDVVALENIRRTRLEDEVIAIARYGYVTLREGLALIAGYRREGFVSRALSHGGLLGRRRSATVQTFNQTWWAEVERWNGRDQASLDYAAWRTGVSVAYVPGTIKANDFAAWRPQVVA